MFRYMPKPFLKPPFLNRPNWIWAVALKFSRVASSVGFLNLIKNFEFSGLRNRFLEKNHNLNFFLFELLRFVIPVRLDWWLNWLIVGVTLILDPMGVFGPPWASNEFL